MIDRCGTFSIFYFVLVWFCILVFSPVLPSFFVLRLFERVRLVYGLLWLQSRNHGLVPVELRTILFFFPPVCWGRPCDFCEYCTLAPTKGPEYMSSELVLAWYG